MRSVLSGGATIALALGFLGAGPVRAVAGSPSTADIATKIKADVAEIVAGINAHDVARATQFDAPDLVSMESGRKPSFGAQAEREGFAMVFKYSPSWHLSMIDETVDVARAGDMAVYRSTYNEDSVKDDGTAMTHVVNFIAGFRHETDGSWKMAWSVVCAQSPSHKK